MKFAFVSCQDINEGKLNGYRRMIYEDERAPAAEQLGFVLHLGDFIYEIVKYPEDGREGRDRGRRLREVFRYPTGKRLRNFHFPVDLADYRTIYQGYLQIPELQDAHGDPGDRGTNGQHPAVEVAAGGPLHFVRDDRDAALPCSDLGA